MPSTTDNLISQLQSKPSKKIISLIIPCYNEEVNIEYSYKQIIATWANSPILANYNYEIVYIDDGSMDATTENIQKLASKDKSVRLIELSRNFGKENALTAGLHSCIGDAAIMLDVDMQYPVDKLPEFAWEWEKGFDVVIGVRDSKKTTNIIEKFGSKLFYIIMDRISETNIKSGALDYRLMDRKVINQFKRLSEHNRITRALIDWLGFKRTYISYTEVAREFGTPAYSFGKRVELALNSFVTHSFFPMIATGYLGLFIISWSLPTGAIVFVTKYFMGDPFGWNVTSGVCIGLLNSFLTGVILSCFGLMSNYIANIQKEAMNRPLFVIRSSSYEIAQPRELVKYTFPAMPTVLEEAPNPLYQGV
ncbi:MAG: glycosyltransferase family 2 protein [Candidatus Parcubacteria bacterium]|nr:glycosyltransferase family 2 protein [Candidatus Paceibacterota bacterium]